MVACSYGVDESYIFFKIPGENGLAFGASNLILSMAFLLFKI